jgi:hypothetical protein
MRVELPAAGVIQAISLAIKDHASSTPDRVFKRGRDCERA